MISRIKASPPAPKLWVRKRSTAWKASKYGAFSGSYFPVFGLNTLIYSVNLPIQSKFRKMQTKKNSLFELFHVVKLRFQNRTFDSVNKGNSKLETKLRIWIVLASWKQTFYPKEGFDSANQALILNWKNNLKSKLQFRKKMLRYKKGSIVSRINSAFLESKLLFQNQSFISKWLFQFKFETSFLKSKSPFWIQSFWFGINASFPSYYKNSKSKLRFQLVITNQTWSFVSRTETFLPEPKLFFSGNMLPISETKLQFWNNKSCNNKLQMKLWIWILLTYWKQILDFKKEASNLKFYNNLEVNKFYLTI